MNSCHQKVIRPLFSIRDSRRKIHTLTILSFLGAVLVHVLPAENIPSQVDSVSDKLVHVVVFLVLGYLLNLTLHLIGVRYASVFSFVYCLFFGLFMELLQEFLIDSRSGDMLDFASDSIGVLLGIVLFLATKNKYLPNKS